LVAPKVAAAVCGIILNFGGAYFFGIPGIAWAGVIFSSVYLLWILFLSYRRRDTSLPLVLTADE
jgi:hypothetical protein